MLNNPIVVVDDDGDDQEMIAKVCHQLDLPNKLVFLHTGDELIDYLRDSDSSPFMILCDVNLPRRDGFTIRDMIEQDKRIHYKSVPFLFWSTAASEHQVRQAYDKHSQGFFAKPSSLHELRHSIKTIVDYWNLSQHPKPAPTNTF